MVLATFFWGYKHLLRAPTTPSFFAEYEGAAGWSYSRCEPEREQAFEEFTHPHQSSVFAQSMETPPALRLEPRQPDAVGQSDGGDVGDPPMQKQVINLVAALKNIKTLAQAAKDSEDVDVLRNNFEMISTLVNKALPRSRKKLR